MSTSLAVKYRPNEFNEVCGQNLTTTILSKVIEAKSFKNVLLFAGPSGCGKTTLARLFANKIDGEVIETDSATLTGSNNGVSGADNIRALIDDAGKRSLFNEYKVYIIDECHALSSESWQAFLKCLEDCPKYSIFIFCTTEVTKLPATILNRVQRFNLSKIPQSEIYHRLVYVCRQEGYTNYEAACDFISRIAQGGMRDSLCYLDKCVDFSTDLSIENVKQVLGEFSFETMIKLTNCIIDHCEAGVYQCIDKMCLEGRDLKAFISNYTDFIIDCAKYIIFKDINVTSIPSYLETVDDPQINLKYAVNFENSLAWYNAFAEALLDIKNLIKADPSYKTTIEIKLAKFARGINNVKN